MESELKIIDTFTQDEISEYQWALHKLKKIFRNGPIYGNAVSLLIDEIVDKRKKSDTGLRPGGK